MTKQPTLWCAAGAQPKYGIRSTQEGGGRKLAIQWISRWNGFIYIKFMYTVHALSKMVPALVARQSPRVKMAAGKWQTGKRRSNQLWLLGGRVWQGSMIMEYYHGLARIHADRATYSSRRNLRLRLLPFGFTHVHKLQLKKNSFACKRSFFEQKKCVWSPPLRFRHLLFLENTSEKGRTWQCIQ